MTDSDTHSIDRLDSGLTLVTVPMAGVRSATIMIMAGAGSRYEDRRTNGLSHFMEHMFFKGAEKYRDAMAVASAIDGVGGLFNAFTSEEKVAYYVKLSAAKKEMAYDVLSDMLLRSRFDQEEIDRERGVIIEEIRMYNDDPMSRIHQEFKRHFYGDQPLGWDVAGPEENIRTVTRDDFLAFRAARYQPASCVVVAAGAVTREEHLELASRYFDFPAGSPHQAPPPYATLQGERTQLISRQIEQAHFIFGYPIPGDRHDDQPAIKVMNAVLGGGMSSRLFHQVRERRGLAYYIRAMRGAFSDTGALEVSAGVNVDRLEEALSCARDVVNELAEQGATEAEVAKCKENIKGKNDLHWEDSMAQANLFGSRLVLYGQVQTPAQLNAEIDAVTFEQVNDVARRYLDPAKVRLSLLGPVDDATPYDTLFS